MKPKYYLFVIDTNRYAGNFEREMCAYMTGQIGDCEVGDKLAKVAEREIPEETEQFEDIIEQVPDEHGCYRPASISIDINSVTIYFRSIPNPELMKILKERAQKFAKKEKIKVLGFRLLEYRETYTEIDIDG